MPSWRPKRRLRRRSAPGRSGDGGAVRRPMRRIVVSMSVSLDGFMAGPNGELDWHRVDDELHRHFNERLGAMSAFLGGRVSYELMAGFWPTADADPTSPEPIIEFARIWREMPKFVYSRTLEQADWNTTIVRDVVPEEVLALKAQPGGDMALGGADLAAAFARHDLIDEYWLYMNRSCSAGASPCSYRRIRPSTCAGWRPEASATASSCSGTSVRFLRRRSGPPGRSRRPPRSHARRRPPRARPAARRPALRPRPSPGGPRAPPSPWAPPR